jgi:uncharacterized protein (DUF1015 family)
LFSRGKKQESSTPEHHHRLYQSAQRTFSEWRDANFYQQPNTPCLYSYRITNPQGVYLGVVLGASLADYFKNRILYMGHTYAQREVERFKHLEAMNSHTGAIHLLYEDQNTEIHQILSDSTNTAAEVSFFDIAQQHELFPIKEKEHIIAIMNAFKACPRFYIADGQHRIAAAARYATSRRAMGALIEHSSEYFMAMCFPAASSNLRAYHRILKNSHPFANEQAVLQALSQQFECVPLDKEHYQNDTLCLFIGQSAYKLLLRNKQRLPRLFPEQTELFLVGILHSHLLNPLFNIYDPWLDPRLSYWDSSGSTEKDMEYLSQMAKQHQALAFYVPTPSIQILLKIANMRAVIPPKSAAFLPQLAEGMIYAPV